MVYGVGNTDKLRETIMEKFQLHSFQINKTNETPGGYGDLRITYSTKEESSYGRDSGSFILASTPNNCNLIWMGGVGVYNAKKGKSLKFEILEMLCTLFGHTGILISQVSYDDDSRWKVYEQYGFKCILQDRGIQHGNNNDMRIYYKPLNEKKKERAGGKAWASPVGFVAKEDLRIYGKEE